MTDQDLNSLDESEIEAAFFSDGYQLAKKYVGTEISTKSLYTGIKQLYAAVDKFIELFLEAAAQGGVSCECGKGCSWCCNQTVYMQSHELDYLRKWSLLFLSQKDVQEIRQKANEKYLLTSKMNNKELHLYKAPCPMLVNGECRVYQARPMACRVYMSYQVSSCQYENDHPEDKSRYPQLFDFPFKAGRKMNEGFTQWLTEKGESISEFTMEEGIALDQQL